MNDIIKPKGEKKDPKIGMIIKGYEIKRCLGKGGMGDVYYAEHPNLGPAAVKFFRAPNPDSYEIFEKRFKAEGEALIRLRGVTHIATVYEINDEEPHALIMEYVDGDLLSTCIKRVQIWNRAEELRHFEAVVETADALIRAHEAGIVHRDVKEDNIMVKNPDGKSFDTRLIDFGICKREPEEGDVRLTVCTSAVMGTVMTAAPEQLRGSMEVGPTADIYALGVIGFRLFNKGEQLLGKEDQLKKMNRTEALFWATEQINDRGRTREKLSRLDPRVAEVIEPCIRPDPEKRPQTMQEVYDSFQNLYLELLTEHRSKSDAMTAEVPVMSEKDLSPSQPSESLYPATVCGMPTKPGPSISPDKADEEPAPSTIEPVSDSKADPSAFDEPDTTERVEHRSKTATKRKITTIVSACIAGVAAIVVTGLVIAFSNSSDSRPKGPARTVKAIPPPMAKKPKPAAPKKPTIPSPPAKGQRPSDAYIAYLYRKIDAKCRRTDPRREAFDKFPHYRLGCIRYYAQKMRDENPKDFDTVTRSAFIFDEGSANFCFYKRLNVCGKGKQKRFSARRPRLKNECKLIAYKIGMKRKTRRRKDGSKPRRLTYFLNGAQAKKISLWISSNSRRARRAQIRTAWIKSQPPDRMLCFKK